MNRLVRWTALAWGMAIGLSCAASAVQAQSKGDSLLPMPGNIDLTQRIRYSFVPNDPLFGWQWHLANSSGYPNVNVVPAWSGGFTGSGVTIGIVDDGLQISHPDLQPNYVAANSWDFGQNDPDPSPVYSDDNHGTSVAGVAAARGGNSIGVTGVAPEAGLAGLRIDFNNQTTQMFVDATLYHSSGANTDIRVKNHSYGYSFPFIPSAAEVDALAISAGAGTVHVFAAGNERQYHGYYFDVNGNSQFDPGIDLAVDADASKKATQNSVESIVVAALGANGLVSPYSNFGGSVFVTAPSNGGGPEIATTDRVGTAGYNSGADPIGNEDYTSAFGGTSSASPLVAGIMALGVQANPAMDVRMAKHLLVKTSTQVDAGNPSWQMNAAGNWFSPDYGFGLVDANAFTTAAGLAVAVTPLQLEHTGTITVNQAITGAGGNTVQFSLNTPGKLEEMEVNLNIVHDWRGDLEAYLTSPSGTVARLFSDNLADSFNLIDWTFVNNAFWGEDPVGQWSLQVLDTYPSFDDGFWYSMAVTARMGDLMLIPEPSSMMALLSGIAAMGMLIRPRRGKKSR